MNKKKNVIAIILCFILLFGNVLTLSASELNVIRPVGKVTLTSEDGTVYQMNIYSDNRLRTISNTSSVSFYATTDDMVLVENPSKNTRGSMSDSTWDPTTSVKFNMTITYTTQSKPSQPDVVRLDKVTGSMDVQQANLTISNQKVGMSCVCPAVANQEKWFYPTGRSFSYDSGFSTFVPTTGSAVGACWNGDIARGSKWRFEANVWYVLYG